MALRVFSVYITTSFEVLQELSFGSGELAWLCCLYQIYPCLILRVFDGWLVRLIIFRGSHNDMPTILAEIEEKRYLEQCEIVGKTLYSSSYCDIDSRDMFVLDFAWYDPVIHCTYMEIPSIRHFLYAHLLNFP